MVIDRPVRGDPHFRGVRHHTQSPLESTRSGPGRDGERLLRLRPGHLGRGRLPLRAGHLRSDDDRRRSDPRPARDGSRGHRPTTATVTAPTPRDTAAVAPSTPPPTISVAIPEPERLRLAGTYLLDAAAADSLRKELAPRLTTVQAKEKLQTAADLLAQARAAAEAENVEAAANLAHKARLLVEELIPR